jgi:glycosyltransferase involved in cell wall biosynthesis
MLNQDYPYDRYEIILVDGMSTDRPRELVQAMAGKRDVAVRIEGGQRCI